MLNVDDVTYDMPKLHFNFKESGMKDEYVAVKTCEIPEQYYIFNSSSECVAYLKLRHGIFTVSVPHEDGKLLLTDFPYGDDSTFSEHNRTVFLYKAINLIDNYYADIRFKNKLVEAGAPIEVINAISILDAYLKKS